MKKFISFFCCRQLGHYKGYVKNRSNPEGSIAETYIKHECVTFCNLYLKDSVEPPPSKSSNTLDRFNLSVVTDVVRAFGPVRQSSSILSREDLVEAHWVVLRDCTEVEQFLLMYFERLHIEAPELTLEQLKEQQKRLFPDYFQGWVSVIIQIIYHSLH